MTNLISIERAARYYRIAPIKIHLLIRQGMIKKYVDRFKYCFSVVKVDWGEIEEYFATHSEQLEQWQQLYEDVKNRSKQPKF